MGKVVLSMFMSLDGYVIGPNGQFTPPQWSDDLGKHWSGFSLGRARHLLYGRTNFQFNKEFWEGVANEPDAPSHAGIMNTLPKTVFSRTLTGDPGWNGKVVSQDIKGEVERLKREVDGDIYMYGGANIAQSLMREDLFDEYRLMITPDLFGDGVRLFEPGFEKRKLQLVENLTLDTGAVIVHYRRAS